MNTQRWLHTWFDGVTLKQVANQLSDKDARELGSDIGQVVARLHNFPTRTTGFLGDCDEVKIQFDMTPAVFAEYINRALQNCGGKIGRDLSNRAREFTRSHSHLMDHVQSDSCICHGDFHPNNLIVNRIDSRWHLVGIVDWESALAWTPMLDIAHLFRRPLPNERSLHAGVVAGYESATGTRISGTWPTLCGLFQLLSWVDKLAGGEEREIVVNSAKEGIQRILTNQGY